MAKSEDERIWGALLSVATRDFQMVTSIINQTVQQMAQRLQQLGEEKKGAPEYLRLVHLMTMTGGLKYMMEGVDGVMQALILDMLKDFGQVEDEAKKED